MSSSPGPDPGAPAAGQRPSSDDHCVHVDVLVIGGGMSGLAAAATVARSGMRVRVVEKLSTVGGSAALSAGNVWTFRSLEDYRRRIPGGDADLARLVIDGYPGAIGEIRSLGVPVSEPFDLMALGISHTVELARLFAVEQAAIEAAGGMVTTGTAAVSLVADGGVVAGAVLRHRDGMSETVLARRTVLCSGGFQGSAELRATFLGRGAAELLVRSNPGSTGDGLRLGRTAGVALTRGLSNFYGHLVPSPMASMPGQEFIQLSQYESVNSVLVNRRGERYCDESDGDEINNQATFEQPGARAVLVFDGLVHRTVATRAPFPNGREVDRFAEAERVGARTARAASLQQLADLVGAWGVDPTRLLRTLQAYNAAASGEVGVELDAPMPAGARSLDEPPFFAVEVQPSVTFTHGGLRASVEGRALDNLGDPVPGLLLGGVDIGGLSNWFYGGGLAPSYVTGSVAGRTAVADLVGDEASGGAPQASDRVMA